MRTTPFAELAEEEQLEVLRGVAVAAAPAFGFDVHRLEVVLHGFNTTFRLETPQGSTVALRVNTNSLAEPEHLRAQWAWLRAIAAETTVLVPVPVATLDGEPYAVVPSEQMGRDVLVVVNSWLDGEDVGQCDPEQARALGRTMAALHRHAAEWSLPPGTSLPIFSEPLLGEEDRLASVPLPGPDARAVLEEAMARCRAAFAAVLHGVTPVPVHGDLHGGNLKWHRGGLAVFDFDDCGLGAPALDLATATFYLRDADGGPVEAALRSGYAEVGMLPQVGDAETEALVASRQLLLANSLLTSSTPALRAMAPEYLERTVLRLRHWLTSGRFVLDPPPA